MAMLMGVLSLVIISLSLSAFRGLYTCLWRAFLNSLCFQSVSESPRILQELQRHAPLILASKGNCGQYRSTADTAQLESNFLYDSQ